jgi:Ger(x)C family germination protein
MLPKVTVFFFIIGMLVLPGCWDMEDINRRGIANVVFFDTGDTGRFKTGVVLGTPGTEIPPIVGTTQQFEHRHYVITGEGDSMVAAWSEVQAATVRDIFFGQTRAIVLSEELAAEENINDLLDFIGRIPLLPPNIHVLIAKDEPEKLLAMPNRDNYTPGNYIDFYFQSPAIRSLAIPMELWRVNSILDQKISDPFIPLFEEYQQMYRIAGTGLFNQNRMFGELSKSETEILALIRGTDVGYLTVHLGENQHAAFGFSRVRSKTKITPHFSPADQTLAFNLDVEITGGLVDARVRASYPHREIGWEEKQEIERKAERMVKEESEKLLAKLQDLHTDPIGFGGKLRIAYPREWKALDWKQLYPKAKMIVKPSFTIRETGLYR